MNDFLTGFIEGLAAKPLYVGTMGEKDLSGQMVAVFTGFVSNTTSGTPELNKE